MTDKIVKMYGIPVGDKVVLIDRETLQYTTMFFEGMDGAYGKWRVSGHTLIGNFYGSYHWNTSQKYWYYKHEEDE